MTYGERRIIVPKDAEFKVHEPVAVTHNDIDYNGHMNNANYIRIANEYLPEGYKYNNVTKVSHLPFYWLSRIIKHCNILIDNLLTFRK